VVVHSIGGSLNAASQAVLLNTRSETMIMEPATNGSTNQMVRRVSTMTCVVVLSLLASTQVGCLSAQRAAEFEQAAAERSTLTGKEAPDFTLPNQDNEMVNLGDQRGNWVVVYFYPADGTPGCTCQAQEFSRSHEDFQELDARVFGISPDTVESHRQVADEFGITVDLLADPDREVMAEYGASVDTPFGPHVVRSTVLIDPEGLIAYHWPEVIPEGHADRVRAKLGEFKSGWNPTR
jgi:peroxiredoxin Q/BCP